MLDVVGSCGKRRISEEILRETENQEEQRTQDIIQRCFLNRFNNTMNTLITEKGIIYKEGGEPVYEIFTMVKVKPLRSEEQLLPFMRRQGIQADITIIGDDVRTKFSLIEEDHIKVPVGLTEKERTERTIPDNGGEIFLGHPVLKDKTKTGKYH